jgi:hypothetical protein
MTVCATRSERLAMSTQRITLDNVRTVGAQSNDDAIDDTLGDVTLELTHMSQGERIQVTAGLTFESAVVLWDQLGKAIREFKGFH